MKNRFKQQTILARYTRFLGLGLAGAVFCLGLLLPQAAMADPGYQLSVNNGPYSGGNTITVTDGTFGAITNVLVGGVQAAITGSGTTWFTITLPATGLAGAKDIVVQTSDNGAITLTGAYTVNPAGKIGTTVYGPFAWTNLASGMNDSVRALVHDGMNLYAGGNFTTAGGVAANYVAKWDSSSGLWTNLGSGMDGTVRALLHDGTNLYAGGDFTTAGGVTVNRVAKWDSSSGSWTNMGNGMNGNVYALSSDGTNLYAGGAFTPDNEAKVAKWDAASGSWTNLVGSWASGTTAYALAHDGATLFAGGYLTHPSDHPNYATARYAFQWSGAGGPWESIGTWMNSTVSAFTLDGESLYAGGTFTMVGGVAANRVGKWDTALHVWTNLGTGMNGSVNALAHDGANLYAGGAFTTAGDMEANRVGKWNAASSSWTNLASSMNNTVNALAHDGTNLYAGGIFSTAGGVDAKYVAKWGPSVVETAGIAPASGSWAGGYQVVIRGTSLCDGTLGDVTNVTLCGVAATLVSESSTQIVVTAGVSGASGLGDVRVFSTSFGETIKANAFTYMASGLKVLGTNGTVIDSGSGVSPLNGTRFAPILPGATVTNTLSITNNSIALLTISGVGIQGTGFSVAGLPTTVSAGAVSSFDVVFSPGAAGSFTSVLSISNNSPTAVYTVNLAGSCYQLSANRGPFAGGNTITVTNGNFGAITNVLVGGVQATLGLHGSTWFTITLPATGSAGAKDIVVQTSDNGDITLAGAYMVNPSGMIGMAAGPSVWTNLSSGVNATVLAMASGGADLYVGGWLTAAGGVPANRVAKWDGASWTNLGSGVNGFVRALAHDGANLYAGGEFTTAGGAGANRVAKWDGASWTNLGSGMNSYVYALVHDGANLYAGGQFTTADGGEANRVAKWDGASWTSLGSGMNSFVSALAHDGTNLYAGGSFTTAGGIPANYVAKWDGTNWTSLGSGMSGQVSALAHDGTNLYAGGSFSTAGGVTVNGVAKWDGSSWTNLGSGISGSVMALTADMNGVCVAGYFYSAGGIAATNVAMWTGTAWTNLSSGIELAGEGGAYSLVRDANGTLHIGGELIASGSLSLTNIAKWVSAMETSSGVSPSSGSYTGNYQVVISGTNLCDGTLGDVTSVTLNGISATVTGVNGSTQIVVIAGVSGAAGLGDVRVFSTSFGETVKADAFTYTAPGLQVLGVNGAVIASESTALLSTGAKFAPILPGATITNTLSITNNGTALLTISGFGVQGAGFSVAGIPVTVSVGAVASFDVVFSPGAAGSFTSVLSISNNSPTAVYTVNLAGSCYQLSANRGPFAGGNTITVTNGNFGTITNVLVGGVQAVIMGSGTTWFTITLPATGSAGAKDIVVQTSDNGAITLTGAYMVNPSGMIGTAAGPSVWTNLSSGVDSTVMSLASGANGDIYAGGMFVNAGGKAASRIAKWNGTSWTNLGSGVNGVVRALARDGANLYAGGEFTTAGGVTANRVAKWDASSGTWTNLGTGINGTVYALAHNGTNLYAGGIFTTAGGVAANNVAKWDGTSWTNLGSGTSGEVDALVQDGTNLYAGGYFTTAGGVSAKNVAKWNGTSWTNLSGGVNVIAYALAHDGTNLFAGGSFTTAGGASANNVAKWNGTSWTNLGSGTSSDVMALSHDGTNLYAGGNFTTAGGVAVNRVAKWDVSSGVWTNMGTGMNEFVLAIAQTGANLYACGGFTTADGVAANRVAKWGSSSPAYSGVAPSSGSYTGGYQVVIIGTNLCNGADITNVTLCGVAGTIQSQSATQIVVTAGVSGAAGLGDVRVFSTSFGETVKADAFTYTVPGLQVLGVNGAVIASESTALLSTGAKFAPILPGATITNTLSITNNGTALLTISGFGVQGAGFSVAGIPVTVSVGAVASFDVVFSPGAAGSFTSVLSISNNSPTAVYTVNLAGSCYQRSVNNGPYSGGNSITVTNGNFGTITNVLVGGVQAVITGSGTTWFTITLPATGSAGAKDIVVQTDSGDITLAGAYTVNPAGVIGRSVPMSANPIAGGGYHSLGLKSDGSVVAWGANDAGQATVPAPNSNFVGVAAGNVHSLGVQADGSVVAWGANNIYIDYGQTNVPAPNADFVAVAAGNRHSLGLKSNGMIMAWGDNAMGQATVSAPNTNFVAAAAGGFHSLGLKSDGTLTAWGENSDNQTAVPAPNSDFVAAAAGFAHSLGLKTDGTIVAWGRNNNSQATVPSPNTNFVAVAAGYYHSLGLKSDGTIVAWGRNNYGQTNVPSPNANFVAVAAGYYHSLGLKADGMIVVWGNNSNGQTNVPAPNTDFGMGPAILPSSGSYTGNYQVVISGTNLCDGTLGDVTNVTLCGVAATVTGVSGSTQIVVTAAAGMRGTGDVRVFSTSFGETVKADGFTYLAPDLQVQGPEGFMASGDPASSANRTDFGEQKVGSSVTQNFSLYNAGNATLINSNVNLIGPGAAHFQFSGVPASMDAGGYVGFSVTFQPTAPGSFTTSLVISNNAPASPFVINFTGTSFALSSDNGPYSGGNSITVTNGTFGNITNVLVGGVQATITGSGATWFTITLPAIGSAGVKDIVVQTSDNGDITLTGAYTVNPAGRIGSAPPAKCWIPDRGLLNGTVYAVAGNSTNEHMFAGGDFDGVCAEWDGSTWTTLAGDGDPLNGTVYALVVDPATGHLFAGGSFYDSYSNPYECAEWDGVQWNMMDNLGWNNNVYALAIDPISGALVAGGDFEGYCAQWDLDNGKWNTFGSLAGVVQALAFNPTNGVLFAAGYYSGDGGYAYCAQWDPDQETWSDLGDLDGTYYGTIYALAIDPQTGVLAVGGSISGYALCAQWDEENQQWNPLGNLDGDTLSGDIRALTFDPETGSLVAGGYDSGNGRGYCAAWDKDGLQWNAMGTLDSTVYALTANSSNGVLAAGGYFNGSFVEWKTPTWTTLAGLNGYVTALISDPATGHLIAGGGFSGYCAEWDGSQWTPLGTLNGRVSALAINPITGKLIAGGDFDGYCAEWNGSEWITLGLLDNSVVALSVTTNGNVIAGGYFTGYCAEWNGTEWTTLGELSSYVYALTVNTANGHVIAGGDFSGSCAEWNGSAWIPLGAVGGQVYALAVNPANGHVIAGGYFPGNGNCAEWNGSEWTTLGAFDSSVSALFVTTNGNVIAGGNFTGYCAEWNGTAWTTRGALDADVYAIAKDPVTGFVALGGNFTGYCLELGVISDPGVSPASGLVDGGYQVIISGTNLCNGTMGDVTSVTLCGVAATVTGVSGSTQIVVTAGVSGVAGLGGASVVSTSFGETVKANVFTYTEAAGLQPPIALSAIDVTTNRFTARWTASEGATNYLIDVSETNTFASHTGIYNNWNVGDATECLVTGLTDRTTYYYRLRAANSDGVSTNSNTVEVPVSDNTPYVQYERTNGVASLGSSDVIVMTNLFHGAGMSYSVVSNSNPALVTTSFTNSNLILEYTPGESGSATITVRVTDLSTGFFVETTFTVAVVSEPTWVAGPIVLNRQNGLYEQSVTVSNTSPLTAKAVTLTVTNLTAGARLYNATGADDHGNPEIQWAGTLPGHSSMVFKLQYYTARRGAVSAAVLVSLSLEDPETLVSGTEGPELKDIDIVPGAVMLEFSAVPGRTYYIRYQASDSTWKTVQPSIVAPANRVQWIDAGPPGTESAPGSVPSRNYKVIEAAR